MTEGTQAAPENGAGTAPRAPALSIRFVQEEDRLRIQIDDITQDVKIFEITRRLTGPLIEGLASLLETSNPTLERTPSEMKADAMEMTHQANVSAAMAKENAPEVAFDDLVGGNDGTETSEPETAGAHKTRLCPPLVKAVHFTKRPDGGHDMVLEDLDGERTGIRTSDSMLHGILALLIRKSREAHWNLPQATAWAGSDRQPQQTDAARRYS